MKTLYTIINDLSTITSYLERFYFLVTFSQEKISLLYMEHIKIMGKVNICCLYNLIPAHIQEEKKNGSSLQPQYQNFNELNKKFLIQIRAKYQNLSRVSNTAINL
ncbi:hypothetical protein pb186bvf_000686 [Paramecium bursaria]